MQNLEKVPILCLHIQTGLFACIHCIDVKIKEPYRRISRGLTCHKYLSPSLSEGMPADPAGGVVGGVIFIFVAEHTDSVQYIAWKTYRQNLINTFPIYILQGFVNIFCGVWEHLG